MLARARLDRTTIGDGLLAAELGAAWHSDRLAVLSALARIYSFDRRARLDPRPAFVLGAFPKKFCAALLLFGAELVAIRTNQPANWELGVPGTRTVQSAYFQPALHHRILDCDAGSI